MLLSVLLLDLWCLRHAVSDLGLGFLYALVVLAVLSSYRRRRPGDLDLGDQPVGRGHAWLEALLVTLLLCGGAILWSHLEREPYEALRLEWLALPVTRPLAWVGQRLVWATWQQVILHTFLVPVLFEILGSRRLALLGAAGIFGVLHLPTLTVALSAALVAGVWTLLFRRGRRLLPLILAHATLVCTVQTVAPGHLFRELHVGHKALRRAAHFDALDREENRRILRTITTDAYYAKHGATDHRWVRALYREVLGRRAEAEEARPWVDILKRHPRLYVAKHFVALEEVESLQRELGDAYRFPLPLGSSLRR